MDARTVAARVVNAITVIVTIRIVITSQDAIRVRVLVPGIIVVETIGTVIIAGMTVIVSTVETTVIVNTVGMTVPSVVLFPPVVIDNVICLA